jgi:hypothetical protein
MRAPLPQSEPQGRCSTKQREHNGRVMFAPIVDGVAVDGDGPDDCFDFEDNALEAAGRLAALVDRRRAA